MVKEFIVWVSGEAEEDMDRHFLSEIIYHGAERFELYGSFEVGTSSRVIPTKEAENGD